MSNFFLIHKLPNSEEFLCTDTPQRDTLRMIAFFTLPILIADYAVISTAGQACKHQHCEISGLMEINVVCIYMDVCAL